MLLTVRPGQVSSVRVASSWAGIRSVWGALCVHRIQARARAAACDDVIWEGGHTRAAWSGGLSAAVCVGFCAEVLTRASRKVSRQSVPDIGIWSGCVGMRN